MVPRFLLLAMASLFLAAFLAGCSGTGSPRAVGTPAATPATEATTPVPQTTAPPALFPNALPLGTPYTYGRQDIAVEATVSDVRVMDGYQWWSPGWGQYYNTTPESGDHFLFAHVSLVDRGTARGRFPPPSMFILSGDGNTYSEYTERDNSLSIKGFDVKQFDYYYNDTGGWIDPGESNKIEGFLLYEVPASLTPDHAYLDVTFTSQAAAVWKLG